MKFNKSLKIFLIVFALCIAGIFANTQSASAKTKWTKGIPTALRGTFRSKSNYTGPSAFGDVETIQQYFIGGKTVITTIVRSTGNPTWMYDVSYHHAKGSHYYYVKGETSNLTSYFKVQLNGKKLRFKTYLTKNKKGKTVKLDNGTIKSYSLWLYKGQHRNKYALGAL